MDHPFGREYAVSGSQLFVFFSNNLYLGQWELARASLSELRDKKALLDIKIDDLLIDVTNLNHANSIGSESVLSPQHLSWLVIQEIQDSHERKEAIKKQAEFELLLVHTCEGASADVIQDIYNVHQHRSSNSKLHVHSLAFLSTLLLEQPHKAHTLVAALSGTGFGKAHNESILNIYNSVIGSLLNDINTGISSEQSVSKLCEVLSGVPVTSHKDVLTDVVKTCQQKPDVLPWDRLLSCVFRAETSVLLELVLNIQWELEAGECDLNQYVLNVCLGANREVVWRQLTLSAVHHGKHVLDMIMECGMNLIMSEDWSNLRAMFTPTDFKPLKPLLLLIGWDRCHTIHAAQQLIHILGDEKNVDVLEGACSQLTQQADLASWCYDNSSELLASSDTRVTMTTEQWFQGLLNHSVLFVLYHCTTLSSLPSDAVLKFLSQIQTSGVSSKGKAKSVRFSDSSSTDVPTSEDQHSDSPISDVVNRDKTVYVCYLILKLTMDIITGDSSRTDSSVFGSAQTISGENNSSSVINTQVSDEASNSKSANEESNLQLKSEACIASQLDRVRELLRTLYPLSWRLEVLENMFSVLFVRGEDVWMGIDSGESGDEELGAQDSVLLGANSCYGNLGSSNSGSMTPVTAPGTPQSPDTPFIVKGELFQIERNSRSNGVTRTRNGESLAKQVSRELSFDQELKKGNASDYTFLRDLKGESSDIDHRGNLSSTSVGSRHGATGAGFIASDEITKQLLALIHDCCTEIKYLQTDSKSKIDRNKRGVSDHKRRKSKQGGVTRSDMKSFQSEKNVCSMDLESSVEDSEVSERLDVLMKYVSDAQWRYTLVCGDITMATSSDDTEESVGDDVKKKRKRRKRRKSGRLSGQSEGDTCWTSESSAVSSACTRKRQNTGSLSAPKHGVISKMLSSKETLLDICLKKGRYGEADQVIKMYNLEDSVASREVAFGEQYQSALNKLHSSSSHKPATPPSKRKMGPVKGGLGKTGLKSIKNLAAVGVASMSVTGVVDQLLSLSSLPAFPQTTSFRGHLDPANIPMMVVVDLACGGAMTWDVTSTLLEIAQKRLPARTAQKPPNGDSKLGDNTSIGVLPWLQRVHQLTQLGEAYTQGLMTSLTEFTSLHNHHLKHYVDTLRDIEKVVQRVDLDGSQRSRSDSDTTPSGGNKPNVRINMKYLVSEAQKHLSLGGVVPYMLKLPVDATTCQDFLNALYNHVKTLSVLQAEMKGTQKSDMLSLEYFSCLDRGPTKILGDLLFVQDVKPQQLEKVTSSLNIDLSRVIVDNCCVSAPLIQVSRIGDSTSGGRVILNNSNSTATGKNVHPGRLVAHILTKVVHTLREFQLSHNIQCITGHHLNNVLPTLADHLEDTGLLAVADHSLLMTLEEALAYYGNLYNLLTIHSMFYEASQESRNYMNQPGLSLDLAAVLRLSKFAYNIRDLGVVSLFDLIYVILRKDLPTPDCYNGLVKDRVFACDGLDPWYRLVPPGDPKMSFLLLNEALEGPALQVLYPDLVMGQLAAGQTDFLVTNVSVDLDNNTVTIPNLLREYTCDFGNVISGGHSDLEKYRSILEYMAYSGDSAMEANIRDIITKCSPLSKSSLLGKSKGGPDLSVRYVSQRKSRGLRLFDNEVRHSRKRCRRSSLPAILSRDPIGDAPRDTLTVSNVMSRHDLNPATREYLKSKSDVISTVTCDVNGGGDSPTGSDYPIWRRYLQSHITPLTRALNSDIHILNQPIKNCILQPPTSAQYNNTSRDVISTLVTSQRYQDAIHLTQNITTMGCHGDDSLLMDYVLCCGAKNKDTVTSLSQYLMCIEDVSVRVRAVLGCMHSMDVYAAIQHIQACLSLAGLPQEIQKLLQDKLEHMQVYKQITECMKRYIRTARDSLDNDGQITTQTTELANELKPLTHWKHVYAQSTEMPELILDIILHSELYDVARKWIDIHGIHFYKQEVDVSELVHCLQKSDHTRAFELLHTLRVDDETRCVKVCENVIDQLQESSTTLIIINFMLEHLLGSLDSSRLKQLHMMSVGCKALNKVPKTCHQDYKHLISSPLLIVEQMLMNMKIEWAGLIIKSIRDDIGHAHMSITSDMIDNLVVTYAKHALQFDITGAVDDHALRRSESRASVTSTVSQPGSFKRVSTATQLSGMSPQRRFSILDPQAAARLGPRSPSRAIQDSPNASPGEKAFEMPPEPPPREKWVPDAEATVCMCCKVERFSMFNRRHHCRRCGRVVCGGCSTKTTIIGGHSARTCDDCYNAIFKPRSADDEDKLQRLRERLTSGGFSASPIISQSPQGGDTTAQGHVVSPYLYTMALDEESNTQTRQEFYYDHAPSTSLCLSILDHHSNVNVCGKVILDLCDDVSKLLQPVAPGMRNPEVDYVLVISMLKYLLLSAKMRFMECHNNGGVDQCDVYLDRVNILDLLVTSNHSNIPSIQQLTKMDVLRRLRDKLIEEERLRLAMDLSTKCGIDPTGVWAAWGLTCLREGQYTKARDRFTKCLKAPTDKNQTSPSSSKLLNNIITTLQNNINKHTLEGSVILAPLKSTNIIKDLLHDPFHIKPSPEHPIDAGDSIMTECLYYLSTYGGHRDIIQFYLTHMGLLKTLHYVIDKRCNADVFVESVLIPSMETGTIGKLLETMEHIDSSLNTWASHLTAVCRHLNKTKAIHMLYRIQIFMKDYIRAAMTCVQYFYQHDAKSYTDLQSRIHYLHTAKQHLDTYLNQGQWTRSRVNQGATPTKLIMTPQEVNKYVHVIELQTEVTKYLCQYHDNYMSVTGARIQRLQAQSPSRVELPMLFGSTKMKGEVAAMVLLCGNNVHDGFGLAFRIIQDCKLDSTHIYCVVGRDLAEMGRLTHIKQLLSSIKDSGLYTDQGVDQVISAAVVIIGKNTSLGKEVDGLIKMMRADENKIKSYIECGKLRSAYLVAVRCGRVEDVIRIGEVAESMGKTADKQLCDKWLQQHQQKLSKQ